MDELEERLNSHARAFEGLMSIIPAERYYGKESSDEWPPKKQTKEEHREAKRAKLDPTSHRSAKDVMDENERKRKRQLEGDDGSDISFGDMQRETPGEGLKRTQKKAKKMKVKPESASDSKEELPKPEANNGLDEDAEAARRKAKAEKKKEKQQKQKEKQEKQRQKAEAKKAKKESTDAPQAEPSVAVDDAESEHGDDDIADLDVSGLVETNEDQWSTASPSPAPESPGSAVASASSSSSIVPPLNLEGTDKPELSEKPKKTPKYTPEEHEAMRVRLQAKIEAMRARRKADGPDGRPARNRAELIEARRKKEEERRAAKKASRQLAKEDELRLKAEAELARLRGSGSPLSSISGMLTPRGDNENFSFGRVAWGDGQQMDSKLTGLRENKKKKGPSDARTALIAAEKKRSRINGLEETKRADIEQKDAWLNAKKKAHGEKVRDDTSLLKKTLKRQEKAKKKSENDWKDRIAGVQKGKEMRQKKREENLKKRKEEKGGKGKKKGVKTAKKVRRPGFEGTFKSR